MYVVLAMYRANDGEFLRVVMVLSRKLTSSFRALSSGMEVKYSKAF